MAAPAAVAAGGEAVQRLCDEVQQGGALAARQLSYMQNQNFASGLVLPLRLPSMRAGRADGDSAKGPSGAHLEAGTTRTQELVR
jgi:hypothetical protein